MIPGAFERHSTVPARTARLELHLTRSMRVTERNLRFRAGGWRRSGGGERPFGGKAAAHAGEPRRIRSARSYSTRLHVSQHASGPLSK